MDITHLITHPEELNQETLYDLRKLVAVYPTYHAARILFLQNLFILHDPAFDQELRRAALLVPDRRVLFTMTQSPTTHTKALKHKKTSATNSDNKQPLHEPCNTEIATETVATTVPAEPEAPKASGETPSAAPSQTTGTRGAPKKKYTHTDTTSKLLNEFLDSTPQQLPKKQIKADPSTDYMSFLMQQEDAPGISSLAEESVEHAPSPLLPSSDERLFSLIDSFIASQEEGINLSDDPMIPEGILDEEDAPTVTEEVPTTNAPGKATITTPSVGEATAVMEGKEDTEGAAETPAYEETESSSSSEEEFSTTNTSGTKRGVELSETLAQIYIKQQKYERAIEVLGKISTDDATSPNPYLADQIRFLQKLAHLNAKKSTKSK